MAKLISLEGATIVVPAGWTATAGQYILHSNSYNFYCNGIGECQGIAIGYSIYFDDTPILEEDTDYVSFYLGSPFGGGWAGGPLYSRESIVLSHFTGELATDETFIQWLLDNNAEITGGVWEEEDPMTQLSSFLTNIANSIRNKKSTTEPIPATNFATEIDSIETGGGSGLVGYSGGSILCPYTGWGVNGVFSIVYEDNTGATIDVDSDEMKSVEGKAVYVIGYVQAGTLGTSEVNATLINLEFSNLTNRRMIIWQITGDNWRIECFED